MHSMLASRTILAWTDLTMATAHWQKFMTQRGPSMKSRDPPGWMIPAAPTVELISCPMICPEEGNHTVDLLDSTEKQEALVLPVAHTTKAPSVSRYVTQEIFLYFSLRSKPDVPLA